MNPVEMNYIIVLDGLSEYAIKNTQIHDSVPVNLELNDNGKSTVMDSIFDVEEKDSVAS